MKPICCILTLLLLIGSASALNCREPYKTINDDCCIDNNNNSICDYDENLNCTSPKTLVNHICCERGSNGMCIPENPSPTTTMAPEYSPPPNVTTTTIFTPVAFTAEDLINRERNPSTATTLPILETTIPSTSTTVPSAQTTITTESTAVTSTTILPSIASTTVPHVTQTTQSTTKSTMQNQNPPSTDKSNAPFENTSKAYDIAVLIIFGLIVAAIVLYKLGSKEDD